MALPLLAASVLALLFLGYRFYGRFIERQYAIDDANPTPAVTKEDGVDFVPTGKFYLLGQHFSAIAAAGPIAGPILACQQFGWLPAVLWICFGVVFIGAVHDFAALVASVRHDANSIAEVVKIQMGKGAGIAMLAFIWVALIYVIVAFADVTASTFVTGDADLKGLTFQFNQGGAVALSSILYLFLALVMGVCDRLFKPPLWLSTAIFVPLTLVVVWAGTQASTLLATTGDSFVGPRFWTSSILIYCFLASLLPVWLLLQPRGYLGGFVLYLALAVGTFGLFFGGFEVAQPAFRGFAVDGANGLLFPFLFVTIACGACSGFHGLVCSGTTSRQIAKESHCRPVGFGAMLLEGFVAIIALGTVMIAAPSELAGKSPGAIYGTGIGRFLAVLIGEGNLGFAITFGAMAFSTFVFDTLDVSTRLGRYILQELFDWKGKGAAVIATLVTCAVPLAFVQVAGPGAWRAFWTLFGTSNQLLAALSLLGISVWLKKSGKRYLYAFVPMLFVGAVTLVSLVLQIHGGFFGPAPKPIEVVNAGVCVVFLALTVTLMVAGFRALFGGDETKLRPAVA